MKQKWRVKLTEPTADGQLTRCSGERCAQVGSSCFLSVSSGYVLRLSAALNTLGTRYSPAPPSRSQEIFRIRMKNLVLGGRVGPLLSAVSRPVVNIRSNCQKKCCCSGCRLSNHVLVDAFRCWGRWVKRVQTWYSKPWHCISWTHQKCSTQVKNINRSLAASCGKTRNLGCSTKIFISPTIVYQILPFLVSM